MNSPVKARKCPIWERGDKATEIFITDAHTAAALAAVRELGQAGCHVTAMAEKGTPALGLFSKYATCRLLPAANLAESLYEEAVLDGLYELKRRFERKPVLLACGTKTQRIAARHPDRFALECLYLGPGADALYAAEDKRRLERAARELGLRTPPAWTFDGAEDISALAKRVEFPVIVKYWGGEKLGLPPGRRVFAARGAAELSVRYTRMYDVQSPVLLQRYVEGDSICVAGVLDAASRPVALFTYRRVRQSRGVGTLYESLPPGPVTKAAAALFVGLGLRGVAMAEFRGSPEDFYLTDLNTRLWRGFPLTRPARAGLALTYALAACGEILPISDGNGYRSGVKVHDFLGDVAAALGGAYGPRGAAVIETLRSAADKSVLPMVREKGDGDVTRAWLKSLMGRKT